MKRTRSLLGLTVGALAIAALTGCGTIADTDAAADTPANTLEWEAPEGLSGSLTVYAANPQGLNENLAEAFTEATGVEVNIYGDTTGKITARLDAEWDNPQADVVYLASWSPAANYAAQGRMLDYAPESIDTVHSNWVGDGFAGRDGSALTLVVNTNVAPEVPGDWADLAAPAFKDQVIMPDPRESGTARDLIAAMVSAWGEDATWELFDDLFANGLVVQGANGPALDDVIAGSHSVVLGGVDYSAYSAINRGESLEVVIPSSGTTVSPRPVFILESTSNPEAAKALVDFFFSVQGQALSAASNMLPAQPEVPVASGNVPFSEVALLDYSLEEIEETGTDVLAAFVARYLS